MRALFADLPEAVDNTLVIARRCAVAPQPVAPILPAFPTKGARTETDELRAEAGTGLDGAAGDVRAPEHDSAPGLARAQRHRHHVAAVQGNAGALDRTLKGLLADDFLAVEFRSRPAAAA